jgi:hypothetical protein
MSESSETTTKAIQLWQSYIKRGAPSNAAGTRNGLGRTKEEASKDAGHWNNQAPWEGFRRVWIYDEIPRKNCISNNEALAWELLSWLDDTLPPTKEGKDVLALMKQRLFASAIYAYYEAKDAGKELVRP